MIEATRFGRVLSEGGCIGVPAPASPWENRSDLLRGVEWWQAGGYRVKLADGIEARDSYVAGDPKSRASDLTRERAAGRPGRRRGRPGAGRPRRPLCAAAARRPGHRAAGRGRPVAAAPDHGHALGGGAGGGDLFFEGYDAPPWYVDGMLTQLGQAGKLAGVVAVAVGDMERCDWSEQRPEWPRTRSLEQVLEEHLQPLGVPVLYKLPVGHARHLAPFPWGCRPPWTPTRAP